MENSGNEAKKYLKTKEATVLNAANSALFTRRTTHFAPQKEQETLHSAKTKLISSAAGHGLKTTHCRLDPSRGAGILPAVRTVTVRPQRARCPHHALRGLTAFQIPWYSSQVNRHFMSPL
jgi:hypothetical protein